MTQKLRSIIINLIILFIYVSCNSKGTIKQIDPLIAFGQLKNDFIIIVDVRNGNITEKVLNAKLLSQNDILNSTTLYKNFIKNNKGYDSFAIYGNKDSNYTKISEILNNEGKNILLIGPLKKWKDAHLPTTKN